MRRFSYLLLLILLLVACSERRAYVDALGRAKAAVNEHPFDALAVLDSLGTHESDFGKHFLMQYRLLRLNTLNKLDTVFRSTTEAQTLADYFDDHGTSNEQMLAHYLLGRAYYDLHEAPMALHCFQEAAEKADTTASDCDYRQLSRVYGQMASLFYHQNLMAQSLRCDDKSIEYALKGKDTLNAILSMAGQFFSYEDLHQTDSAIYIGELASELALKYGYKTTSVAVLGGIIRLLIDKGELKKAKHYMDRYERESGFFDSSHCIERGREMYYNIKGFYFLSIERYDSAEYFFRKELGEGKDFNNQNAGSRGLALLYKRIHFPDSAAKYALYSYEMNDSVYSQMAIREIEQIQGMYDYSRNQMLAQREKKRADSEKELRQRLVLVFLSFGILICFFILRERAKKAEAFRKYKTNVSALALAQVEMVQLRSQEIETSRLIQSKEKQIVSLQKEVNKFQKKEQHQLVPEGENLQIAENRLSKSPLYKKLLIMSNKGQTVCDDDWQWIYSLAIEHFPLFWEYISSKKFALNESEFNTCVLIRLHVRPVSISEMLEVTTGYVSKVRIRLYEKLFGEQGTSKQFDERIMKYA